MDHQDDKLAPVFVDVPRYCVPQGKVRGNQPTHHSQLQSCCRRRKETLVPTIVLDMVMHGWKQTLCLNVDLEDSIDQVELMLKEKIGVAMEDVFFLYGAKVFRKDSSLRDHGVQSNSTIHLCVRQRGGCFIFTFTILTILFLAALGAPFTCGASLCVFPFLLPLVFILPFCLL